MHRPNLKSLTAAQRAQLAQLIQQYVTPAIVNQHAFPPPAAHAPATILSWHRNFILGLENFLVAQGHPEWSPLPAWNPAEPIPAEFNIPNAGPDRLLNLNPGINFSPDFDHSNLGNFETDTDLGMAIMGRHGSVHITVGGLMGNFRSPAAPIFWPWHSFLDDIWWAWQRQTVVTPNCLGLTLNQARALLTSVGINVGTVTTVPHLDLPFGFPFPWPPQPQPPQPPGFPPFPFPWPPQPPIRQRPHRHVVVDQSPDGGDRVHHGVLVDLVLGRP